MQLYYLQFYIYSSNLLWIDANDIKPNLKRYLFNADFTWEDMWVSCLHRVFISYLFIYLPNIHVWMEPSHTTKVNQLRDNDNLISFVT